MKPFIKCQAVIMKSKPERICDLEVKGQGHWAKIFNLGVYCNFAYFAFLPTFEWKTTDKLFHLMPCVTAT